MIGMRQTNLKLKLAFSARLAKYPRLKRTASQAMHKWLQIRWHRRAKTVQGILDINKTLWVQPDQLQYVVSPNRFQKHKDRGRIVGGD